MLVEVGSGLEDVSVGLVSIGDVCVPLIPLVGLGGIVGFILVAAASVGVVEPCFGAQPARTAPAATVAVSFRNVRREKGGRWVMDDLRIEFQ